MTVIDDCEFWRGRIPDISDTIPEQISHEDCLEMLPEQISGTLVLRHWFRKQYLSFCTLRRRLGICAKPLIFRRRLRKICWLDHLIRHTDHQSKLGNLFDMSWQRNRYEAIWTGAQRPTASRSCIPYIGIVCPRYPHIGAKYGLGFSLLGPWY